jgi:hypothetical protein
VARVRNRKHGRKRVGIGAPEPSLTPNAGLAAISELVDRLHVVASLDAAVGPIKQRNRGHSGGFGSD